tara:strand:+ start:107 stop:568 length:462 start_codon:yes stop_codon:yes gene_type:complete
VCSYYNEKEGGNNMKITLTSIEHKMAKSGAPFSVVKDTNGETYTIWNEEISKKLIFGQPMDLVIKEANGFKNIRGIGEESVKEEKIVNTLPSPQIQVEVNKPRTTRYAVEVGAGELSKLTEKVWAKEGEKMDWDTAQEMVWNTYQEFKKRLGE